MCVGRQVRALVLKNSGDDPKVAEYLSANGDDKVSAYVIGDAVVSDRCAPPAAPRGCVTVAVLRVG